MQNLRPAARHGVQLVGDTGSLALPKERKPLIVAGTIPFGRFYRTLPGAELFQLILPLQGYITPDIDRDIAVSISIYPYLYSIFMSIDSPHLV